MNAFVRAFGIVPLGVGLCVLGLVWSDGPFGMGGAPLFFRLIFSLVAGSFVLGGLGILTGIASPANQLKHMIDTMKELQQNKSPAGQSRKAPTSPLPGIGTYVCPGCGARLDSGADVSPHGDVKCGHCRRWFNIHQT